MEHTELRIDTDTQPIRVFILAKPDFYLDGIIGILSGDPGNQIVACISPGEGCEQKLADTAPEVMLIHHQAIQESLPHFLSQVKQRAPQAKIIIFGQGMTDTYLVQLVRAGADGYINDNMSGKHLLSAIRKVGEGELWVERHILERLVRNSVEIEDIINAAIAALQDVLTKRETEVFRLVLEGLSTKEIAHEMNLSEQSVKLHLGNLFKKFDVTNRAQLILLTFQKVCPVNNVLKLFRTAMDKTRIAGGKAPLIADPLDSTCDDVL